MNQYKSGPFTINYDPDTKKAELIRSYKLHNQTINLHHNIDIDVTDGCKVTNVDAVDEKLHVSFTDSTTKIIDSKYPAQINVESLHTFPGTITVNEPDKTKNYGILTIRVDNTDAKNLHFVSNDKDDVEKHEKDIAALVLDNGLIVVYTDNTFKCVKSGTLDKYVSGHKDEYQKQQKESFINACKEFEEQIKIIDEKKNTPEGYNVRTVMRESLAFLRETYNASRSLYERHQIEETVKTLTNMSKQPKQAGALLTYQVSNQASDKRWGAVFIVAGAAILAVSIPAFFSFLYIGVGAVGVLFAGYMVYKGACRIHEGRKKQAYVDKTADLKSFFAEPNKDNPARRNVVVRFFSHFTPESKPKKVADDAKPLLAKPVQAG